MKRGFTLVELLAVIVVLSLILIMGVIKISNVINESKDKLFIDNAKTIISLSEQEYLDRFADRTLDQANDPIECSDVFNYTENEYKSCSINFLNEKAYITLEGNNKFDNRYICGKDKNNIIISNVECDLREKEESNGTIVNVNNMNLSNNELHIMGYSIQNGTPTPESPVPVISLGELSKKIYLEIRSKNILSPLNNGVGISSTNGLQTINSKNATTDYIPVDFNTNSYYFVSGLLNTLRSCIYAYNINHEFLGRISGSLRESVKISKTSFSSGTPSGTGEIAYLRVSQYYTSGCTGTIEDLKNVEIQLEEGTSATLYEPYKEKTIDISLTGHEPLRCIDDVCDYIDYKKSVIVRKITAFVFDGTENLSYTGYTNCFGYEYYDLRAIETNLLSNTCIVKKTTEVMAANRNWGLLIHNIKENGFAFTILNSAYTNYTNFNNYIKTMYKNGTTVIVYYQSATPKYEPIQLPEIKFFEGTNYLSINDGNLNSKILIVNYKE